eukprot:CAMPEP_0118681842 /NCGR_PEP_ID=MMETSP0800-20121206/5163_1 /TAXON_ID=210618 ORGANISM="Striatella unipunctata, Strain CCMP2910" /NCGR_SAMPLE_ID=MMETSP0800 /ASSEMBLY_ACC=CAM_ASM_000638 /LENGTH=60 /DNA_ID=CAMNT_0006578183 /DNA_START=115 /DNA_END=297 /DNA_ORIENTATION=-
MILVIYSEEGRHTIPVCKTLLWNIVDEENRLMAPDLGFTSKDSALVVLEEIFLLCTSFDR